MPVVIPAEIAAWALARERERQEALRIPLYAPPPPEYPPPPEPPE